MTLLLWRRWPWSLAIDQLTRVTPRFFGDSTQSTKRATLPAKAPHHNTILFLFDAFAIKRDNNHYSDSE